MALFQVDEAQFGIIDEQLGRINGTTNALAESIADLSANIGKWQAAQLQAIKDGFVLIADVLSNHQTSVSQEEIDAATNRLKSTTDELQTTLEQAE